MIVDASILASFLIKDEFFDLSEKFLREHAGELRAPDIIVAEVANVVWKHVTVIKRISSNMLDDLIDLFYNLIANIEICDSLPLLRDAFKISVNAKISIYDSLYLTLSLNFSDKFATFDRSLLESIEKTEYSSLVILLGSSPLNIG